MKLSELTEGALISKYDWDTLKKEMDCCFTISQHLDKETNIMKTTIQRTAFKLPVSEYNPYGGYEVINNHKRISFSVFDYFATSYLTRSKKQIFMLLSSRK